MGDFERRKFLGGMAAAAAAAGGAGPAWAESPAGAGVSIPRPPRVTLGDTGVTLSRLGQGTGVHGGRRQSDQTRLGFAKFVDLFLHAYERGVTFFDLADLYGSHVYFREALRSIPREEIAILTKVWWRYDGPETGTDAAHRAEATRATLQRFRHELSTDYIDIVLLHCLMRSDWQDQMTPYMEVLDEAKRDGTVRAVGVSCHDFGALRAAADSPWVDVILARINPRGVKMDASPGEVISVLRRAKAAGKSILGMKIFGEGQLVEEKEACIRYAQQHDFMDAMTIGFETPAQIDEVLTMMDRHAPARS